MKILGFLKRGATIICKSNYMYCTENRNQFCYIILLLFSCCIRVRIELLYPFLSYKELDLIVWSFGGEDLKSLVMVTSPHEYIMSSGILNITQYLYSLYYSFIKSYDEQHYHCELSFITLFYQLILDKK